MQWQLKQTLTQESQDQSNSCTNNVAFPGYHSIGESQFFCLFVCMTASFSYCFCLFAVQCLLLSSTYVLRFWYFASFNVDAGNDYYDYHRYLEQLENTYKVDG